MIAERMHFDASTTTLVGWLLSGLSRGRSPILGRSFRSRGWASQPSPPWKTLILAMQFYAYVDV